MGRLTSPLWAWCRSAPGVFLCRFYTPSFHPHRNLYICTHKHSVTFGDLQRALWFKNVQHLMPWTLRFSRYLRLLFNSTPARQTVADSGTSLSSDDWVDSFYFSDFTQEKSYFTCVFKKMPEVWSEHEMPPPILSTVPLLAPSVTVIAVFTEPRASAVTHPAVFLQTHAGEKYQRADLNCKHTFKCSVCGVVALPHLLWATNILLQSHFHGSFHIASFLWLGSCRSPVNTHTHTHTHTRQTHACRD